MKNNWSESTAQTYIKKYKKLGYKKDVALRVYTSRLLGRNPDLVIHGGGNTSVKTKLPDLDGKSYDVLCVKGSGWDMADIEPQGLPAVKLKPLLNLKKKRHLTDEQMVNYQKRHLLDVNSPNPSVETFLHAFLPLKYVDHTHANPILDITDRPDGLKLCKKIFNSKVAIVPYVMPGFMLAKKVQEVYEKNPNINCLILLKHGIFTFSDNAKDAYSLMIKYVTEAEVAIKKLKHKKIRQITNRNKNIKSYHIAPILRGLLSDKNSNDKFIINFRKNKELDYFMNGKNVKNYSTKGTITPDHVIRIKPFPLIIENKDLDNLNNLKKLFTDYKKKYIQYFKRNKSKSKGKKIMLDTLPRLIYVQNMGLFSVGKSMKDCIVAGDLAEANAKVITSVEETSQYRPIAEKDLFDVEYWSLEQAKIKKASLPLQGNVVVITGACGVIGYETYKLFKSQGAEVVLLDKDVKKINTLKKKINDLCIECDVTNKKSVTKAFEIICGRLGGIDILISNAGSADTGAIAEIDEKLLRKSFENNFFSHQNCASQATKIMLKQNNKGCLLFNISKQSVNPGKNFGPYGLPKAALLSLCKQYALDYGSNGIRSNGVNADRIQSGLLNKKMIKARAKARSVTITDYMKGNLLHDEVTSKDVANAFLHLALSQKTTGAILTVDGGNIAASMR